MSKLTEGLKQIGQEIKREIAPDNPVEILEKLQTIITLQASASHWVSLAKKELAEAKFNYVNTLTKEQHKLPASVLKQLIEGSCGDADYNKTLAERYATSLSHSIDGLRSMLSYVKEEMSNINN